MSAAYSGFEGEAYRQSLLAGRKFTNYDKVMRVQQVSEKHTRFPSALTRSPRALLPSDYKHTKKKGDEMMIVRVLGNPGAKNMTSTVLLLCLFLIHLRLQLNKGDFVGRRLKEAPVAFEA